MFTPNDTNNLMRLFKHRKEDVNALTELAATDDVLKDKLDTLVGELDTVSDLVYDIHDYLYDLKKKRRSAVTEDSLSTTPYSDNRTPWGFAANRGGNMCSSCYTSYMNGYMTCPGCGRTL